MFLEKISNFLVKNRKKIIFYSFFILFIFIVFHNSSFATVVASTTQTASDTWVVNSDTNKRLKIWNSIVASIASVLGVFTYLVTLLLDPKFISGELFGINNKLHELWILMSNIVYFIFAFILIWIALMNIIWKGDKWELKQALPKFIIWVLIVPFSWFFVSLIISLSNILTFAALSLPAETFTDYKNTINSIEIPNKCYLNLKSNSKEDKWWFYCEDSTISLWSLTENSIFWLVSAYTNGLLKVDSLSRVSKSQVWKAIESLEDLIIYILFSGIFILIYFILMMALAIVLLVRVIWLWIYMALSPLFWLAYFFWKDSNSEIFKKINVTEFIGIAMVPVYTTLALSFWFLFLSMTMTWLEGMNDQWKANNAWVSQKYSLDENGITLKLWEKEKKVRLEVIWWAFSQLSSGISKYGGDFINWTFGFIWAIFMNIFWVVIFRIAIMAALQSSSITKEVITPIKQFGESVWDLVKKSPTYAPIFPGGKSMTELSQAAATVQSSIHSSITSKWSDFWKQFLPDSMKWWSAADMRTINEWYKTADFNRDIQWAQTYFDKVTWKVKNIEATMADSAQRKEFVEMIARIFWEENAKKIEKLRDDKKIAQALRNEMDQSKMTQWWRVIYDSYIKWKTGDEIISLLQRHSIDWVSAPRPKQTNNDSSEINLNLSWKNPSIKFWNMEVSIKLKDWALDWLEYDRYNDDLARFIANNINSEEEFRRQIPEITEDFRNKLRTYFDADWKYHAKWWQSNWKFPWEVKKDDKK